MSDWLVLLDCIFPLCLLITCSPISLCCYKNFSFYFLHMLDSFADGVSKVKLPAKKNIQSSAEKKALAAAAQAEIERLQAELLNKTGIEEMNARMIEQMEMMKRELEAYKRDMEMENLTFEERQELARENNRHRIAAAAVLQAMEFICTFPIFFSFVFRDSSLSPSVCLYFDPLSCFSFKRVFSLFFLSVSFSSLSILDEQDMGFALGRANDVPDDAIRISSMSEVPFSVFDSPFPFFWGGG